MIPLLTLLLCGCHDDRSYVKEEHPEREFQIEYVFNAITGWNVAASAEHRINDRMLRGWDLWQVVSRGEGGLYLVFTRRTRPEAGDTTGNDDE